MNKQELTREQVLGMSGQELSIAVAVHVIGFEPGMVIMDEWYPAEDIAAAWEVLQHPIVMDGPQIGVYPTSFGVWVARPFMPGNDCTVQAKTAPEAICKASLLAVLGL
ncbi:BC1872 family protein [Paenibacillus pinihumi]|uniref:BC1872 family protein n=1 Tax=Paenibacillus pinihumi TaxID=669462 RepID=UPI000400B370|nr:hypothetical protein [Paenibacillus pinihumi]